MCLVNVSKADLLCLLAGILTGVGTLAGAHRLFSHRSFKTHWTFRLFLLTCQTIAGQGSAVRWAREHRTHHRFAGTDADCANINRGFFYAHIGWLLLKPHPERVKREAECDLSDLMADPMIKFQYDYYIPLMILLNIIIPTWVPYYFFDENPLDAFLGCFALRYVYTLHIAFCGKRTLVHSRYDNFEPLTDLQATRWHTTLEHGHIARILPQRTATGSSGQR